MKPGKVRRFMWLQIVLHWGQAGLYLALMATGGTLLVGRLLGGQAVPAARLSVIHRGLGAALILFLAQVLLASLLTGNFAHFRRDLAEWLWLRPRDWLWLVLAPIHALFPRVKLPPAGRYNAGQKLHGAFVFLAVTAFSVTGLYMMFVPGALAAWLVHATLFLAAACFLLLHLFLSLINPATRAALGGMFTGHVLRRYVESHHPLWAGRTEASRHGPMISLKALLLTLLAIALAAGGLVLASGPQRFARQVARLARHSATDAIQPGDLSAAHADIRRCTACHRWTGPPPASACLTCHPEITPVLAARQGYHGQLDGDCRTCHGEHAGRSADIRRLDAAAFNHQQARFALQGQHQQLACSTCHAAPAADSPSRHGRFIGLAFGTCSACHENPHGLARRPSPSSAADRGHADCTACHNELGWRRPALTFDHDRDSRFHLDGRHTAVACPACHSPANRSAARPAAATATTRPDLHAIRPIPASFASPVAGSVSFALAGVGRSCPDCHADPHRPTLGLDCARCHDETGWTGRNVLARFDHNRDSKYPLRDAHAQARCGQCHQPPRAGAALAEARFVGTSTACAACHADPHKGTLARTCVPCHSERGWTGRELLARFDHNHASNFALTDRHAELPCENCHVPPSPAGKLGEARFAGLGTACTTCHKDPHGGQLSTDCARCHGERGWTGRDLLFDHNRDSSFKIDAIHSSVACAACHAGPPPVAGQDHVLSARRPAATGQGPIPAEPGPRSPRYRGTPKTCQGCHAPQADALAGKVGGIDKSPPDPHAGRVDCQKCHQADSPESVGATLLVVVARAGGHTARPYPVPPSPAGKLGEARFAGAGPETPCRDCHGPRYGDLYYQWTRSLADRQSRAEALLAEIVGAPLVVARADGHMARPYKEPAPGDAKGLAPSEAKGRLSPRVSQLAAAIARARSVGMHNPQLAARLWDDILKTEAAGATATSRPDDRP